MQYTQQQYGRTEERISENNRIYPVCQQKENRLKKKEHNLSTLFGSNVYIIRITGVMKGLFKK